MNCVYNCLKWIYNELLQVTVSGPLDYSDKKIQEDMEKLLSALENTTFIAPIYTESWLRSYVDYVDRWKDYPDSELNVDDEQSFIKTLEEVNSLFI